MPREEETDDQAHFNGYAESGDPVLTVDVRAQDAEALLGSAGVLARAPSPGIARSDFRGVEFALDQGGRARGAYDESSRPRNAPRGSGLRACILLLALGLLHLSGRRAGEVRTAASIWSNDDGRILELDYLGLDYWRAGPLVCRAEHEIIRDGGCRGAVARPAGTASCKARGGVAQQSRRHLGCRSRGQPIPAANIQRVKPFLRAGGGRRHRQRDQRARADDQSVADVGVARRRRFCGSGGVKIAFRAVACGRP